MAVFTITTKQESVQRKTSTNVKYMCIRNTDFEDLAWVAYCGCGIYLSWTMRKCDINCRRSLYKIE